MPFLQELSKDLKEKGVEGCVVPMRCDVSKEEEVKSVFSKAKEDLGGVDVCVNNAGVLYITQPLLSQTTEEWRECTDVRFITCCVQHIYNKVSHFIVNR